MKIEVVKHSNDFGDVTFRSYKLDSMGVRIGTVGIAGTYEGAVEQAKVYKAKSNTQEEVISKLDI